MTREEISVLSSARREAVRRQLEEIEQYKSNPFLYILNPRVKVSKNDLCAVTLFLGSPGSAAPGSMKVQRNDVV